MSFTMNYANPDGSFQSTWSRVKLSWVAVSTSFETVDGQAFGNYIWATSIGLSKTAFSNHVTQAQMVNSPFSRQTAAMSGDAGCGYINTSPPAFDTACPGGNDYRFMTHLYIMGFKFNPAGGNFHLAASVLRNGGGNTVLADTDEAITPASIVTRVIGAGSTTELTGPQMLIDPISSQLDYIKIGVVMTTVLDLANYPANNPASFQYAGIYMGYSFYNNAEPIIKAASRVNGDFHNHNYFTLLSARYQIFGLSSFYIADLPPEVTVVDYELHLPGSSTVLLNTNDVNYMTQVRISADQWTRVPTQVCNVVTSNALHIVEKYASTVPTMQNDQQVIYEPTFDLTFNYFASGSYSENQVAPLSSTVTFTNILKF